MSSTLPQDLQDFLTRNIASVVQLELLLLVRESRPRAWTSDDLARELRIDPAWAEGPAADLCERGLLACERETPARYRYEPSEPALDALVTRLAETYAQRRMSVITFIYSQPPMQLRMLSDAFRFRRRDPHD